LAIKNNWLTPIWNQLQEPKVIHAQFILSAALAYGIKRHFGDRPQIVLHVHGQDFYLPCKQKKYSYLHKNLAPADLILTPSLYVKKRIQQVFPDLQRIEAYYTALNDADFPYSGPPTLFGDIKILIVGRLVQKKGYQTALRALAKIISADPSHTYHLRIVGQGPLRDELTKLAQSLQLQSAVEFLGLKANEAVRRAFLESHIYWAPSEIAPNGDEEGLPRTVTEALAFGIPVIATRHAGIPEAIIDHETGLLCDEKDWQGLATKTLWAIKNWANMLKYAEQGRRHFENYFGKNRLDRLADRYPTPLKEFLQNLEA
jgi:glycosyltransferase involved in cell wall biosynthesis